MQAAARLAVLYFAAHEETLALFCAGGRMLRAVPSEKTESKKNGVSTIG